MTDNGNGWYTATYTLTKAGLFTLALGLDGVSTAGDAAAFNGICRPAVCDPEKCVISGLQQGRVCLVAGQQAELRVARVDRHASAPHPMRSFLAVRLNPKSQVSRRNLAGKYDM